VHEPDLPLCPGGETLLGIGPWLFARFGWLHFEYLLYASGVRIYLLSTRTLNRAGSLGLFLLAILLPIVQIKLQWFWIGNFM